MKYQGKTYKKKKGLTINRLIDLGEKKAKKNKDKSVMITIPPRVYTENIHINRKTMISGEIDFSGEVK